jgi:TP901 family phage tail tape measure protein
MAMSAADVRITLTAIDNASRVFGQAEKSLGGLEKAGAGIGKTLAVAGTAIVAVGTAAGVGLAAGLGAAVASASTFEKTMSGIKAVTGATDADMQGLSRTALQIGKDTKFGAGEAAIGIEELAKAGVSIPDIMGGAATATAALAAAGGVDLPVAAEIASNAMNVFNKTGGEMAGVADTISGAVNASAIDMNDYKFSIAAVGAVANAFGFTLEDTTTAIALMGNAGIKGSDAGTSLKSMFLNLQPTTKSATKAMHELGLITEDGTNQFFDATGKVKSFAEIAGILQHATKDLTEQQKLQALETIFGSDAIRAATIVAKAGTEGVRELEAAQAASGGATAAMAARQDNLAGSLEQLKGSIETAAITLGMALLPAIRGAVDAITAGVNEMIPRVEAALPAIQATFANIVAGAQSFAGQLGGVLDTVAQVILDVGFALGEIPGIGPALQSTFVIISSAASALASALQGDLEGALAGLGAAFEEAGQSGDNFAQALSAITPIVAGLAAGFAAFKILTTVVALVTSATAAWGTLSAAIAASGSVIGGIIAVLGGPVTVAVLAVVAAVALLTAAWVGNWFNIREATAAAVDFIAGVPGMIGSALSAIADALNTLSSSAAEALNGMAEAIGSGVQSALDGAAGIIQGFAGAAQAAWTAALDEPARAAIADLGAALSELGGVLSSLIGTAFNNAVSLASSGWASIVAATTGALASVQASVSGGMQSVGAAIQGGWDLAVAATSATVASIVAAVSGLGAQLVGAIQGAMAQVVGAIQSAAGSAGAAAAGVGSSIVEGLRGSISAGVASIASSAANLVRSAIGAARAAADAQSPSKETEKLGNDLIAGLVKGLEAGGAIKAFEGQIMDLLDALKDYEAQAKEIGRVEQDISRIRDAAARDQLFRSQDIIDATSHELELKRQLANLERDMLPDRIALGQASRALADIERGSLADRQRLIAIDKEQNELRLQELDLQEKLLTVKKDSKAAEAIQKEIDALRKRSDQLRIEEDRIKTRNAVAAAGHKAEVEGIRESLKVGEEHEAALRDQISVVGAITKAFEANEAVIKDATDNEIDYRKRLIEVLKSEAAQPAERVKAGLALIEQLRKEKIITDEQAEAWKKLVGAIGEGERAVKAVGPAAQSSAGDLNRAAEQAFSLANALNSIGDVEINVDAGELARAAKSARELEDHLDDLSNSIGKVGSKSGKLPEFATGGVVPGPKGQPTLAIVHGGETVLPPGVAAGALMAPQPFGMGGGDTYVTVNLPNYLGAQDEVVDLIRNELIRTGKANGSALGGFG